MLCGRNARLRRQASRGAPEHTLGWVDDMPGLLSASRALVDNAAGQTALEAMALGVPVVSFRVIPGHGRDGALRMAEHGLADFAPDAGALIRSLDVLTGPGAARELRVATGRGLLAGEGVRPLEALLPPSSPSGPA